MLTQFFIGLILVAVNNHSCWCITQGNGIDSMQKLTIFRWLIAGSFVAVGVEHFRQPQLFVGIVPPYLPSHLALVYISGVFEVLGGVGLLWSRSRRFAGWGLIALLIAVYPANIHMLVNDVYLEGMARERWLLWLRMPLQFFFAGGVLIAAEIWRPKRLFTSEVRTELTTPE